MTVYIGQFGSPPVDASSGVDYGTHTIPRFPQGARPSPVNTFWTSGKPSVLTLPEVRAVRHSKSLRRIKNVDARREVNRNRSSQR